MVLTSLHHFHDHGHEEVTFRVHYKINYCSRYADTDVPIYWYARTDTPIYWYVDTDTNTHISSYTDTRISWYADTDDTRISWYAETDTDNRICWYADTHACYFQLYELNFANFSSLLFCAKLYVAQK